MTIYPERRKGSATNLGALVGQPFLAVLPVRYSSLAISSASQTVL
jgi:hypothetical protein